MSAEQDYWKLQDYLVELEKIHGVTLSDPCVDAENVDMPRSNPEFFASCYASAVQAAGMRAEEIGLDINELIGRTIY